MPRKNPAVPVTRTRVTLEFDGKEYDLAFTFNDLVEAEELAKSKFLAIFEAQGVPPLALLRGMLFIALRSAGAEYESPHEVGEKIRPRDIGRIWTRLMEAITVSKAETQDPPEATAGS